MHRAAVICEFNPFHNGHKFLMEKIKEEYADEIVCMMSGNFVQRGDIAVTDKYARARAALENGADAVVELPTAYAMSGANTFAESGVQLAAAMGCDRLCFGAESDLNTLKNAVDLLEDPDVNEKIRAGMREGLYYPKALSLAVDEETSAVIEQPNNILALGYIRACRSFHVEPIAIARKGAGHDDSRIYGNIASGSKIRELICSGGDYYAYTPMRIDSPAILNKLESAILYRLKTFTAEELRQIADVGEGLENRIIDAAKQFNSILEISETIKTKRYTMAHIHRVLLSAFLNITAKAQKSPVPYCRVLGVRYSKKGILSDARLPLIVKTKADYERLNPAAKSVFNLDLRAAAAMNIAANMTINEFSQGIIVV